MKKIRITFCLFLLSGVFAWVTCTLGSSATCLFFDLDDTLIKYSPVLSHLLAQVKEEIITEHNLTSLPETPTCFNGKKYDETMREAFGDFDTVASKKYMKLYNEHEFPMFPAIDGSLELLDKVLDAEIPFAIVSNEKTKHIWWKLLQQVYTRETYPKKLDLNKDNRKGNVKQVLLACKDCRLNVLQKAWKDLLIKICDSDCVVVVGPDMVSGAKKPKIDMGLLALDLLGVDWKNDIVNVYHVGDSEITDLPFAKNLDVRLKEHKERSFCRAIHFALKFRYQDYTQEYALEDYGDVFQDAYKTVYGFGRLGSFIQQLYHPVSSVEFPFSLEM